MKRPDPERFHLPFAGLGHLVKVKGIGLQNTITPASHPVPEDDDNLLFARAMEGVKPLRHDRHLPVMRQPACRKTGKRRNEEGEAIQNLRRLVEKGHGFRVDLTPEYHEATAWGIPRLLAERLHRGEFAIQDWIDLHGYTVKQAAVALNAFFKRSVAQSRKGLLIVHGRGLRSKEQPVLKAMVLEWLTTGPWRKWVVAAASARLCDGGAGATYVLLRSHPGKKRKRSSVFWRH